MEHDAKWQRINDTNDDADERQQSRANTKLWSRDVDVAPLTAASASIERAVAT